MNFRNQIQDLARPNLFQVSLDFPDIDGGDSGRPDGGRDRGRAVTVVEAETETKTETFSTFLVKAANLPASTIGVIEVLFRGRQLKIAGDRTFEPWTVTIMNDEAMQLRTRLEAWARAIQDLGMNYQRADTIANYQATGYVYHYDRQNGANAAYQFEGIGLLTSPPLTWHGIATTPLRSIQLSSKSNTERPTTDINQPHGRKKKNRNRNRRGRGRDGG